MCAHAMGPGAHNAYVILVDKLRNPAAAAEGRFIEMCTVIYGQ